MLPEALFYSTQKHSQSAIPPESYAEGGRNPSRQHTGGFWSFITIWEGVRDSFERAAIFILVTFLLHHRYILLYSISLALPASVAGLCMAYQQTSFGKSPPAPK